jgi:hypothetical protein
VRSLLPPSIRNGVPEPLQRGSDPERMAIARALEKQTKVARLAGVSARELPERSVALSGEGRRRMRQNTGAVIDGAAAANQPCALIA